MNRINLKSCLTLLIMAVPFLSLAQKQICTTHSQTNEILEQFPERRALLDQLERETQEYAESNFGERAGLKIIPTVIHVIHDYGSENLSKEFLLSAMEAINNELIASNNTNSVASEFQNIIGNPEFELRLAKIDHQGNCTDGITRTASQLTYGAGENVKDLVNWNTGSRRYLQIWVVNSVGSGAGGYTYLPGSVSAERNGIIVRAGQYQGTISHEFGHWMNLAHTWGPTNDNAVQSNCNFDDNVSDTPNTIGTASGCNTSQVSCGSLDNVQNHMDYSSCARMFTVGQATRMQAAAASSIGGRSTYWSSSNRAATGTNDGFSNSCVPTIDFAFDNALGCEGIEVDFEDNSFGADEDPSWVWSWSFPGGTPSSSSDPNPTVTYNAAGTYNVSLSITTAAGSDVKTVQNAVVVNELGSDLSGPIFESIEDASFPNNSGTINDWSIETPGGLTWQRASNASTSGDASVRINLRSITEGNVNSLISPPIDMSDVTTSDAEMTFMLAHSNRTSTSHDEQLRVYVSKNCGETWTLRYNKSGDNLNTAGALVSSNFVPDANEWRQDNVSLASMAGEPHVLIKFEATSDRQSYLYIDDININPNATSSETSVNEIETLTKSTIYPNPIDGTSLLELNLTEADEFTFTLVDVLGKQLKSITRNLSAGKNRVSLNEFDYALNAGFYFIQINTENGQKTVRFVKN